MLVLKINIYNFFGVNNPEGFVKEEKYYKIENMENEVLEKFIDEKMKSLPYTTKTFEIIKLEEE